MGKRIFLVMSMMMFSILVTGCEGVTEAVQDDKKKKSPAVKKVKEKPIETISDDAEGGGQDKSSSRLSAAQRRLIYSAIILVRDKALQEAEATFPTHSGPNPSKENIKPNTILGNQLAKKYLAVVRDRYEISKDEQTEIANEGLAKGWPLPEPSTP